MCVGTRKLKTINGAISLAGAAAALERMSHIPFRVTIHSEVS
jgi:hypothetical protein